MGLEAALLTRRQDVVIVGGTLSSFVDTSILLGQQKVAPVETCYDMALQLESWAVFCAVFFG